MDKGYKFGKLKCPVCGKIIAGNWYIRHLKKEHPRPVKEYEELMRADTSQSNTLLRKMDI